MTELCVLTMGVNWPVILGAHGSAECEHITRVWGAAQADPDIRGKVPSQSVTATPPEAENILAARAAYEAHIFIS